MNQVDPFETLAAHQKAPSSKILDAIRLDLDGDVKPKRSLSRKARVLYSAIALAFGLVLAASSALEQNSYLVLLAAAAFSLSAAALLLAGAVPGSKKQLSFPVKRFFLALFLIATFSALALMSDHFSSMSAFLHGNRPAQHLTCAGHALISGILGSGPLMLLWRRTDPFSPGLTGALLGFFGGLLGTLAVGIICSNDEGLHLTLSHGLSVLLLVIVGILLGRKWLTP